MDNLIEKGFFVIKEDTTLGDIVHAVEQSKRNLFPVVNDDNVFIGYVTLDNIRIDMFNRDLYDSQKAVNYMSITRYPIYPTDTISAILNKFDSSATWNLPVVKENGEYLGFISKSRIFSEYRNVLKDREI